jgi:hypothetical protein
VLEQLTPNKKKMPLQLKSQPRQKSVRVIKQLIGPRSNWGTKDLKEAMDAIERGFTSLKKASWYWNIPLTNLSNHLIDNTTSKKHGPPRILLTNEEVTIVEWVLGMQECNLSISLHQLKPKMAKLT